MTNPKMGRPKLANETVNRSITLTKEQWAHCKRMGRSNASWFIRKLIDEDMERTAEEGGDP